MRGSFPATVTAALCAIQARLASPFIPPPTSAISTAGALRSSFFATCTTRRCTTVQGRTIVRGNAPKPSQTSPCFDEGARRGAGWGLFAVGGEGPGDGDDNEDKEEAKMGKAATADALDSPAARAKPKKSTSRSSAMGGWPWSFGFSSSTKSKPATPTTSESAPVGTGPDPSVADTLDPVLSMPAPAPVPARPDPAALSKAAREADRILADEKREAEAKEAAEAKRKEVEARKKQAEAKQQAEAETAAASKRLGDAAKAAEKAAADKIQEASAAAKAVTAPTVDAVKELVKEPSKQSEERSKEQAKDESLPTAGEEEGAAKEKPKPKAKAKSGSMGSGWSFWGMKPQEAGSSMEVSKPETIVVVTGASGRVGQLTVRKILEMYPRVLVRAVVSDFSKGTRLLQEEKSDFGVKLEIVSADLQSMKSATRVCEGASAVVFCASGFAQNLSPLQRLANAVRLTLSPKSVTDVEGVKDVALALKAAKKIVPKERKGAGGGASAGDDEELQPLVKDAPRFVLLSSAAVTRPTWSTEEKKAYPAAADVPIVKLNPLNILTVKAEGEKELREARISYAVVRPCGLNDKHPRGRPIFSVGDLAAGRICRDDVADVLARCLGTPEATGKTFEVLSLPGLDRVSTAKANMDVALARLPTDEMLRSKPEMLHEIRQATYPIITQLRPVPLPTASRQGDGDDFGPDEG